jgi:hypothetical protein
MPKRHGTDAGARCLLDVCWAEVIVMTQIGRVLWASTLFALVLIALAARPAAAAVEVSFLHPEGYTDAGRYDGAKADPGTLDALKRHLRRLGERGLKPGQTLKIEILDIDLAGRFEPWHAAAYDIRFLRPITWPRIALRYELNDGNGTVSGAEETLADLNYQMRTSAASSSDPLRYEKAMLDGWFKRRFATSH